MLDGAVAALPEDNFLKYCYENVTGTVATATSIYENAAELLLEDMMGNIEEMFDYPYAIIYNCYFTFFAEGQLPESFVDFILNLAFNAGYMYTDIRNIIDQILLDTGMDDDAWAAIGENLGDFIIRFVFREDLDEVFGD